VIDRLYSRTLAIAAHRHAMAAMALISFAESSFFPLPPDFLLVPMTLANPRRAWLIAAVCTITSVVGGYVGYAIGYFLFDAIGRRSSTSSLLPWRHSSRAVCGFFCSPRCCGGLASLSASLSSAG